MENTITSSITFVQKTKNYISSHKIMSVIVLVIVVYTGYFIYGKLMSTAGETRYVLTAVKKGTIISSVTGSGQIAVSDQISLSPKVSGAITSVRVKVGDSVRAGEVLFSIDDTNAQKSVRDAQANLDAAKLDLATTNVQNSNADVNQQTTVNNAYRNLLNSTITAVTNNVSNTDNPPVISGTYIGGKEGTITINIYGCVSGLCFNANSNEGIVNATGLVSSTNPQPIGDTGLFIKFSNSNPALSNWTINIPNKMATNYLSNYNAYQSTLVSQQQTSSQSQVGLLSLQAKQLTITQKENSLLDTKSTLADYIITSPFSGVIASMPVQVGDQASSGTTLATLVTNKQLAQITLNEVDVAKIQLGQKATITFDALPDLSITGVVSEIDSLGAVSQGVVNYTIKISLDTQDDRVKPSMSVSAAIITQMKQNVLLVPNSAVKTQNGASFVQMFSAPLPAPIAGVQGSVSAIPPSNVPVTVGISNGTSTEIISGANEGDDVVTRTITSTTTTATSSASSLLGGGSGGSARGVRIGG